MLAKMAPGFATAAMLAFGMTGSARAQEPERLNVLGTEMVIRVDGEKTGGAMAVVEATVPPGHGPPLHIHSREDELFYIIDGQVRIWHDKEFMEVSSGAVEFLPRNMAHTYKNVGTEPARMLVTITPAAFLGFFREVSAGNLTAPEDMAELQAVAAKYGLEFLGPPPAAN